MGALGDGVVDANPSTVNLKAIAVFLSLELGGRTKEMRGLIDISKHKS